MKIDWRQRERGQTRQREGEGAEKLKDALAAAIRTTQVSAPRAAFWAGVATERAAWR